MGERKRAGRPRKKVPEGQRASLGLKVTAATKRRLEAAADQSGRSQSQEAEFRLERSFASEPAELRDWFAGMALHAQLRTGVVLSNASKKDFTAEDHARSAYWFADAMLAHRHSQEGDG